VLDGVRAAIDMGIPITTQFVLQRENYQEVLAYRDLCLELGVEHMGIQKIFRASHMTDQWWEHNNVEDTNSNVNYDQLIPELEQFKLTYNAAVDGRINTMIDQYRSNI
jgi:MoaA/NifB/PqqE/SkfB family radical SAM enzyme